LVSRSQFWLVLLGYEISKMVRFQCQSFIFHDEFSMMVSFGGLRGLSDGRFWWVMRSQ